MSDLSFGRSSSLTKRLSGAHSRATAETRKAVETATVEISIIATVARRAELPVGSMALWILPDHPECESMLSEAEQEWYYMPEQIVLLRNERGWVDVDKPKHMHREDTLPPLPWRLLWDPAAAASHAPRTQARPRT